MADSFLLVVPDGWVEIENANDWLNSIGPDHMRALIADNDINALSQIFENLGMIPENTYLTAVPRIIDTPDGPRFWWKP